MNIEELLKKRDLFLNPNLSNPITPNEMILDIIKYLETEMLQNLGHMRNWFEQM